MENCEVSEFIKVTKDKGSCTNRDIVSSGEVEPDLEWSQNCTRPIVAEYGSLIRRDIVLAPAGKIPRVINQRIRIEPGGRLQPNSSVSDRRQIINLPWHTHSPILDVGNCHFQGLSDRVRHEASGTPRNLVASFGMLFDNGKKPHRSTTNTSSISKTTEKPKMEAAPGYRA